jgi:hypothetical protein
MSATFTDSQGRTIAVPTLGYSFGATQTGTFLRSGESYTVGVDSCGGNANPILQGHPSRTSWSRR